MADTFRALCAELLDELEYQTDWSIAESLKAKARAALGEADEPAVPEGREPAAVTGQPRPMDEDWDALVNRLWSKYETIGYQGERFMYEGDFCTALDLVRQEIAHWGNPAPAPPADGEVAELVAALQSMATDADRRCRFSNAERLSRAAELLERQALVPVPVSERPPGPEDCAPWPQPSDNSGWCWMSRTVHGFYGSFAIWEQVSVVPTCREVYAHWLPAHSLPLPEVNV